MEICIEISQCILVGNYYTSPTELKIQILSGLRMWKQIRSDPFFVTRIRILFISDQIHGYKTGKNGTGSATLLVGELSLTYRGGLSSLQGRIVLLVEEDSLACRKNSLTYRGG